VAFHPHRPISVRQEGRDARVTTGRLDFLFPDSDVHHIGEAYNRLVLETHGHFAQRWKTIPAASLAPDAFPEIVQEITLHWMYFCAINHLSLQIGAAEWEHPQTRRIIRSAVKRNLQPGQGTEAQLCAHLMAFQKSSTCNGVRRMIPSSVSCSWLPNIYERAAVKTYEALRSDRSPAALGRFPRKHLFAVSAA
jgi:hypothetical protein